MTNKRETIRRIVSWINNDEEFGGLWLPNIQRYFVWKEEQIEKLFDSIMRQYPISTFLIWKTKEEIKMREFIKQYNDDIKFTDFYVMKNRKTKLLVLDGQQRLQSLYLALRGSYNNREFFFNVLSGEEDINDTRFIFKYIDNDKADIKRGWWKLKDIVYSKKQYNEIANEIVNRFGRENLIDDQISLIGNNIARLVKVFTSDENITYQELDSVDSPGIYKLDDVVEVFIRANSGGTPLSKSDLMFCLLTASWEDIEEELTIFIEEVNKGDYDFHRDFILKTCLVLIGAGAKYDVTKFRDNKNIENIRTGWEKIKESVEAVRDFVYSNTYIRSYKALTSNLVLIPLIYFRYFFPQSWRAKDNVQISNWLVRMLLTGSFSGSSDTILDSVIKDIRAKKDFNVQSIDSIILDRGRNVYITKESLIDYYYGDGELYSIFSLWYKNLDFEPALDGNLPTVDHIFPQSILREIRVENPDTGRLVMKYNRWERDQLCNLMVLSLGENRDEKNSTPPEEWFESKDSDYFEKHLIPNDPSLLKVENYDDFLAEREKLILDKFRKLRLVPRN